MGDPLATYLEDHLAGAKFAMKLLTTLRDQHEDDPLGQFASEMLNQVADDSATLEKLIEQGDFHHSGWLKSLFGWFSEVGTRAKLHRGAIQGLGSMQKLEILALGILGKMALWKVLVEIAPHDNRLRGVDFQQLLSRAQQQHALVEQKRLETARFVFISANSEAADNVSHDS